MKLKDNLNTVSFRKHIGETINKIWFLNTRKEYHHLHGPAAIHNTGSKWYYLNSKRHNAKGPAYITSEDVEHWIRGKYFTEETWLELKRHGWR